MSQEEQTLPFEASAYLQRLIGRELISSEELAIIELVKNAYDAGARHVTITIALPTKNGSGEITIRDDGEGMSLPALRRVFMTAGYSERPKQVDEAPRVPTGEKGIGRFAADKLGHELIVHTKSQGAKLALQLKINWDRFDTRSKKFNEITAPYGHVMSPELARFVSGTFLRISRLRTKWDPAKIEILRESLADLLDPFNPPKDFEIDLQVPNSLRLTGPIEAMKVGTADIRMYFKVSKEGKVRRTLAARSTKVRQEAKNLSTAAPTKPISGLEGRLLYFLKKPSKSVMPVAGGVRLYRDGFRVEPFGRASDWLGVAEKKAKRAGHAHVVPSHLFGFVSISRRQQPGLQHTTSRESLLEGEAVKSMVTFLREQLSFLEDHIKSQVSEPRWKESKTRQAAELERSRYQTLSIMSVGLAHELRQPLQTIRTDADLIKRRLHKLNIDDNDIREAQESIDRNIERIDRNIRAIAKISSGSVDDIEAVNLATFIRDECEIVKPRCNALGIQLVIRVPQKQEALINAMTVTTALMNLVQNAIEALQTYDTDSAKRITVSLSKIGTSNVLEVADNGPGIDADIKDRIFLQFASKKTGGWGVGLNNCSLLVKAHSGTISFTTENGKGTKFRVELPDSR